MKGTWVEVDIAEQGTMANEFGPGEQRLTELEIAVEDTVVIENVEPDQLGMAIFVTVEVESECPMVQEHDTVSREVVIPSAMRFPL